MAYSPRTISMNPAASMAAAHAGVVVATHDASSRCQVSMSPRSVPLYPPTDLSVHGAGLVVHDPATAYTVAADVTASHALFAANAAGREAAIAAANLRAAANPQLVTVNPSLVTSAIGPFMMHHHPIAPVEAQAAAVAAAAATNASTATLHGIVYPRAYYN
ncbi:hypothetical protein DIPPA_01298 [Diplonema papillatum]|nr:hypothetical protein DIPPA_01298 [Diplonema papillatum]